MSKISKILSLTILSTLFAAAVSAQCGPGGCNVRRGPSQYGNQGYYQQQPSYYQNFQGNQGYQGGYQQPYYQGNYQQQPYYQGGFQQSYNTQTNQRAFSDNYRQDFRNNLNSSAESYRSDYSDDRGNRNGNNDYNNNDRDSNDGNYGQSYQSSYNSGSNTSDRQSKAGDATLTTIHPNGKTTTESIKPSNSYQNRY